MFRLVFSFVAAILVIVGVAGVMAGILFAVHHFGPIAAVAALLVFLVIALTVQFYKVIGDD